MKAEITSQETYTFFEDPGHGWLEVPSAELVDLGIKPSGYSYTHKGMTYLEEDCDAPLFCTAKETRGEPVKVVNVYQEHTPIRNYSRCRGEV